jgi:hypothetical protein
LMIVWSTDDSNIKILALWRVTSFLEMKTDMPVW